MAEYRGAKAERSERNLWLDAVKFALSFVIIAIHVTLFTENQRTYIVSTHFVECAMPFYSIMTGYYFSRNRHQRGRQYTLRYIGHIVWVYLLWATIEYLTVMTREQARSGLVYLNVRAWLLDSFTVGRFWYFGSMILFALLMELKLWMEGVWGERIVNGITIGFVTALCALMELTSGYSGLVNPNPVFAFFHRNYITLLLRRVILYGTQIMFLGHFVHRYWKRLVLLQRHALAFAVAGAAVYAVECLVVDRTDAGVRTMVPYLMTVSVFIWLLQRPGASGRAKLALSSCLRCLSGFIYCVHIIPIYYYRTTKLIERFGSWSVYQFLFSALVSLGLGLVMYLVFGNRLRKVVA